MKSNDPVKLTDVFRLTIILLFFFTIPVSLTGQPSGGPYGPVRQSWPLPVTAGKIYYVSPDGNRESTGETTICPYNN